MFNCYFSPTCNHHLFFLSRQTSVTGPINVLIGARILAFSTEFSAFSWFSFSWGTSLPLHHWTSPPLHWPPNRSHLLPHSPIRSSNVEIKGCPLGCSCLDSVYLSSDWIYDIMVKISAIILFSLLVFSVSKDLRRLMGLYTATFVVLTFLS